MQQPCNLRGGAFDFRALRTAYFAHVRSLLQYCIVVWAGAAVAHMQRLERVQHKFLIWLAASLDYPTNNFDYEHLLNQQATSNFDTSIFRSRPSNRDFIIMT